MEAFAALADDTRLRLVDELGKGERAVGDLVAVVGLRQPTVSQHLKVLKEAGLVRVRPDAQRRLYSLDPKGFEVIELWLERYRRTWAKRLDVLEEHMDTHPEDEGGRSDDR
jgi:DNA-binding transcriptional ArsR family regulator